MNTQKKTPYRVCPDCGCNLDPCEPCDCKRQRQPKAGRATDKGIAQPAAYRDAMYRNFLVRSYR